MNTITLNVKPVKLTDEEFYQLCQVNEAWRLELTTKGELLIMPPLGGKSCNREARLISKLWLWNCLLYTSPSPRDREKSRMPSSA